MTTLAGLDEKSAEIPGMGHVIADVAREVVDGQLRAEWRATVTDQSGAIAHIVTTRRRPTKALSRLVSANQTTCSFPGCRMPAKQCDFDHLTPWSEGGVTSSFNAGRSVATTTHSRITDGSTGAPRSGTYGPVPSVTPI